MDYDQTTIPESYKKGREIGDAGLALWMDAIERHIDPSEIESILDLGCGTGRFSEALSERFDARLIGIDPSTRMLTQAIESLVGERFVFKKGSAEDIPIGDGTVDLVFLSMVWHHIVDVDRALQEFQRVLRNGGYACVRNPTVELLNRAAFLDYFPGAGVVDLEMLPSAYNLKSVFSDQGFDLIAHDVIESEFAENFQAMYEKVKHRALSELAAISDDEFSTGLKSMAADLKKESNLEPIIEPIDLFVYRMG